MMRRIAPLLLLLAPCGFGYIRWVIAGYPLVRVDNTAIQFYLNNQVVAGAQSSASGSTVTVITADSNPQQALREALATWNAVTTANIHFLTEKSTTATIDPNDFQMTLAIGSTASDLSLVGGALAITAISSAPQPVNVQNGQLIACSSNCQYPGGGILDSDIILNPAKSFSTTGAAGTYDLQAVFTHELGHSLGANHTGILGATMFQFNTFVQRRLSADDRAFVELVYPVSSNPVSFGTVSGAVTGITGNALLTLVDATTGATTYGGITNGDGTFSVSIPPGTYQMYAEPLNGIVQPQYIFGASVTAALFQSTMLPGTVNVTANGATTANIAASGGTSVFSTPDVAVTSVNGTVSVPFTESGPSFIASGQSVDLLLAGAGFDGTLTSANFTVLGQNVTVQPGGVRLDTSGITVGGHTILRVTLNVATQQSLSLASIFVTKGTSTLSLSGALVIGPPTPTSSTPSVISAAGYTAVASGVSPGGLTAVFDIPNMPNLGPATPVGNTGYDPYGLLSPELGGVTVTFDGVEAPLFFVYGGQINLQVPFEVAGKTTTNMVVSYLGSASAPIPVPVLPSQPAFWTVGTSNAIYATNGDGTTNTASNPATKGTEITAYGTGVGVVNYPVTTGEGAPTPPSFSANGFTCTVGGLAAPVAFAGWTPTAVALAQWNVTISSSVASTGAVPIVCTNANGSTQSGLTIFVK